MRSWVGASVLLPNGKGKAVLFSFEKTRASFGTLVSAAGRRNNDTLASTYRRSCRQGGEGTVGRFDWYEYAGFDRAEKVIEELFSCWETWWEDESGCGKEVELEMESEVV